VILRLGHVALTVTDLERSRDFYAGLLCLHEHHREPGAVYLRANEEFDVWSLCLKQGPTAGLGHAAFRVSTPDALADLERLHRDRGLPTRRVPAGHEPGQGEALRARTSDGHPVEFYFAMEQVSPYDEDGRVRLPMRRTNRAGPVSPARIDHVNLRSTDMEASLAYWRDALGFSVSEYLEDEAGDVALAWIRRTTGTHDVALGRFDRPAFAHVAYYLQDPLAVFRAADAIGDAREHGRIEYGPSRHGITNAFFVYLRDPDGNRVELYTGDYQRDLDLPPIRWTWEDAHTQGYSWWGAEIPDRFREVMPTDTDASFLS